MSQSVERQPGGEALRQRGDGQARIDPHVRRYRAAVHDVQSRMTKDLMIQVDDALLRPLRHYRSVQQMRRHREIGQAFR